MNILSMILALLPNLIVAAENISMDLKGHQKKQLVTDILLSTAAAVSQVSPQNAATATAAAQLAVATIDQAVAIVKAKPAPAPPAQTTQDTAAAIVSGQQH